MRTALLALCFLSAPLAAQEGVSVADLPDTSVSVVLVNATTIIGLTPLDSSYFGLAEYLFDQIQTCVDTERPYEDLTIYTALVMYEAKVPMDDTKFVVLPQWAGLFYHNPPEIIIMVTDMSAEKFALTLTHEYIHYLEPAWNEVHVAGQNKICWEAKNE